MEERRQGRGINPAWMCLGKRFSGKRHSQAWDHPMEWHIQGAAPAAGKAAPTAQENPKNGGETGKMHLEAKGVGVAGILWYPKAPLGPGRRLRREFLCVREGIVMSHPPAKVLPGGKGGPGREISKHGNVYLEFGPKERFCEIQREDCLGMKPAGLLDIASNAGKKTWDCCKGRSRQGQKRLQQCFPSP